MGAMDASEILKTDAQEWKKRALAAEAKVSNYRRCLSFADQLGRVLNERRVAKSADARLKKLDEMIEAIEELLIEVALCEKFAEPAVSVYDQVVDFGDDAKLEIRERPNIGGGCSTLVLNEGLVVIEALQASEGKAIGLVYQLLQLSDVAAAAERGIPAQALSEEHLHMVAPMLVTMMQGCGLLDPRLGLTVESIVTFVDGAGSAASRGN